MLHQETNEYGVISIDNTFLNQLIKDSLRDYEGKAWSANYKGRSQDFLVRLGTFDALSEIKASESERGIKIRIPLMVKFGLSMSTLADHVIKYIVDTLKNDLGLKIDEIEIIITGMIMSKGIAKRSVVFRYIGNAQD